MFFSSTNYAFSARSLGFLAQELYPPGINGTEPGIFYGLQELIISLPRRCAEPTGRAVLNPGLPGNVPDPNLPNGITIFPGGFPLYRNGQLIGAIGVSGDGVDQST